MVGDIVHYKFKNFYPELGQVIDVLPNYNCIIKFAVYIKYRVPIIQEIMPDYLRHVDKYEFVNNLTNNEAYTIQLNNIEELPKKITILLHRIVPKGICDAITYEDIVDGDILVDFHRCDNKTENDFDTYYKESTLKFILQTNKNPYTMNTLDHSSIVKYVCSI
jgi:hypothetical protein